MPTGPTLLTAGSSVVDQSSYQTASIAPPADTLVLLVVASEGGTIAAPTVSGAGMQWSLVRQVTSGTQEQLCVFRTSGGTPVSGPVTIDFGVTMEHCCWQVISFPDVPQNGVVQSATAKVTSGTSLQVTLAGFQKPTNHAFGAFALSDNQNILPETGFTEIDEQHATEASGNQTLMSEWKSTSDTTVTASWGVAASGYAVALELDWAGILGQASLQGVAGISVDGGYVAGGEAALQGVGDLDPQASLISGGGASLWGVGVLSAQAEGARFRDFSRFDAYIDTPTESRGLLFYDKLQPETTARRLQPARTDVGDNPEEMRPDFGNFFGQADFHRGMGQRYFHHRGRDPARFFWSEGFDVSEPGKLRHLRAVGQALASTTIGALAQAGGLPFVADGTVVRRGDGNFPGTWTAEDPHAGETPATTVEDLTAEGARLFAALGNNGIHVRSSGGIWSHYKPDGTTNLAISPATRVAWVKDRLMVVGGTDSRSIYEVTGSSSPSPVETLPEGWRFEHIFEAGGFIHACAVNTAAGLSRVHHYGLNSSGTALEKKSSTPLPKDQICFSGAGYLGLAFLGVGRRNADGGYDPILYRATIRSDTGELDYVEVREEAGSGTADLGVRAIAPLGETVLVGWSLGSGAFGGARDGLAIYHFGRDSFAHHLRTSGGGGARRVLDILPFGGRILFSLAGAGLYYEDLATYVGSAQLVSSLADFGSAGPKIWDRLELAHEPLPSGCSVKLEYATAAQENATWTEAFTSGSAGSEGTSARLSGVRARLFAVRLNSVAQPGAAPEIRGFSVRANPSPLQPEYQLVRYLRLLSRDRRDERAELVYQDPRELLRWLQDRLWTFVDFHEPGFSWTAWVEDVSTVEPAQPFYDTTSGEPLRDAFVVRLVMTGVR